MKRSRASINQLSKLVDFMSDNPGLAGRKFEKLHGKFEADKKWIELTKLLNSIGGAKKTVEQWHTVWRDFKSRTSIKLREWKKEESAGKANTDQEHLTTDYIPLTKLEKRVIAIMRGDCIDGDESIPENGPKKETFANTYSRIKRSRASTNQLSKMVDYMFDNPGLAGRKFEKLHGKFEADRKWAELTNMLNSIAGAKKTIEQWHTVWKDFKSRTNIKLREWEKAESAGKVNNNLEPLTKLEKRVITIMKGDCVDSDETVAEKGPKKERHDIICYEKPIDEPNKKEDFLSIPLPVVKQDSDSFEHLGLAWAAKLRKMQPVQSKLAERLISEVLFQGDVGLLTLDTNIQNKVATSAITCINGTVNQVSANLYSVPSTSQDVLPVTQSQIISINSSQNSQFVKEEEILQEHNSI